jgi:TonB family protein
MTFTTPPLEDSKAQVAYDFSVSPDGRPLSIRRVGGEGWTQPGATIDTETQAAFATWTFPASARADCRLILRYTSIPLATADTDVLVRFYALSLPGGALRGAVERRLRRPGDDCDRPPPLRNLAYPDFLRDRLRPGARSWAAVRWDVAPDGTTASIETIGSSGDTVLDEEVRRAMGETLYRSGPRTGCVYNYWRAGPNLPAPPVNRDAPEDPLSQCTEAAGRRFTPGPLTYPPALSARGIEGWARVRFDIAPWGQIGNVAVVEAEPVAAFGDAAMRLVMSGRATPAFEAAVRCVVPVLFRLPPRDDGNAARLPNTAPAISPSPPAPF